MTMGQGQSAKDLTATYLGMAQKNPAQQPAIYQRAATHFARLASDPRNRDSKKKLEEIAFHFAGAAMKKPNPFRAAMNDPVAPGFHHDPAVNERAFEGLNALYPEGLEHAIELGEGLSAVDPGRVSIQPSTFTTETILGRQKQVTFNPTPQQVFLGIEKLAVVAFWQGKKVEAQAMGVDVGLAAPPVITGFRGVSASKQTARLFAQIQYGVDGSTQNIVTCDVGLGRKINVTANYISVAIGMDAPSASSGDTCPVLDVYGSIGTFDSSSQAPVLRTVYFDRDDTEDGFTSDLFLIPARAVAMFQPLPAGNNNTDTLQIAFWTFGGFEITTYVFPCEPATPYRAPIMIPPDAFTFSVSSTLGFPSVNSAPDAGIRIPFQLSL